jgi:hypothetical protein
MKKNSQEKKKVEGVVNITNKTSRKQQRNILLFTPFSLVWIIFTVWIKAV